MTNPATSKLANPLKSARPEGSASSPEALPNGVLPLASGKGRALSTSRIPMILK
jgi:hypothetical protein